MKRTLMALLVSCGIGAGVGSTISLTSLYYSNKIIPTVEEVQQGYITPNELEIECKDLDGNDIPETIIRIDETPYLLRDVDGKPVLSEYRIWSGIRSFGDGRSETFPYEIEHIEVKSK